MTVTGNGGCLSNMFPEKFLKNSALYELEGSRQDPVNSQVVTQGHNLNNLSRSLLDDTTNQTSKGWAKVFTVFPYLGYVT